MVVVAHYVVIICFWICVLDMFLWYVMELLNKIMLRGNESKVYMFEAVTGCCMSIHYGVNIFINAAKLLCNIKYF